MPGSRRTTHRSTGRSARLAAVLATLALLFATASACGSGKDSGDADSGEPAASAGAFPVTIPHKYGSTTLKEEPRRIVTVGLTDQGAVLALGKVPVGTTEWIGGHPGAIGP